MKQFERFDERDEKLYRTQIGFDTLRCFPKNYFLRFYGGLWPKN